MTTALAGRAVACKGWRWMPGMLDRADPLCRVLRVTSDEKHSGLFLDHGWPDEDGDPDGIVISSEYEPHGNYLPDLDDPYHKRVVGPPETLARADALRRADERWPGGMGVDGSHGR